MNLANRIENISPSLTMSITTLSAKLKAQGKDIISFSAGEPDFDTPLVVKQAAINAIENGYTKYTAVDGIQKTKEAIKNKLKKDHALNYNLEDIIISNGAKHSLFNLCQVLIQKGDEVIIPAPYWVTYPEQVKYSNGKPIFINTTDKTNFKITAKQLEEKITSKTKILILNSPSNPTGAIYSKKELEEIGEVLRHSNILIFSDEMYEKIIYTKQPFITTAQISKDMYNRTITINGLSKCVAMTGWRFGYLATPRKDIIKAMIKLQGQSTSNINSITQYAAIRALDGSSNNDIEKMKNEFKKRRDYAYKEFNKIEKIKCTNPSGAFYLFVNIEKITSNSMEFCSKLLEQKGVAIVPGEAFGLKGYFRFSFATNLELIKDGINRIKDFIKEY